MMPVDHLPAVAWGADAPDLGDRVAAGRVVLLGEGKVGIEGWIGEQFGALPAGASGDPLVGLAAYQTFHIS